MPDRDDVFILDKVEFFFNSTPVLIFCRLNWP